MKAPLSWVREFTPVQLPPEEVARTLSFLGLVVDGTQYFGPPCPGIVVAKVLSTRPHPAADRIQLVDVDTGDGEPLQICCGAFNMAAGDLVPLATLGTVMPSGIEIGRRKMRGEWSNGMLCSAPELGIGREGPVPAIYIIRAPDAKVGQPMADVLGLGEDYVFDIDVSPNRSDCFSIAGIARDLAAALHLPFHLPEPPRVVDDGIPPAHVSVDPEAVGLCPRFTGTVLGAVNTALVSPRVARRLSLCGMRPISPVVDVSNYVMLELGQPNHPYDLDGLGGAGLVVRPAADGEHIVTLDGVTRTLIAQDCVIADATGVVVGVAGIMGGQAAEITPATSTVLLEMANFNPMAVAATGKRLGLFSEARARFERGVDIELPDRAIDRFVQLLGGQVRRGPTTDTRSAPPQRLQVKLRPDRVNLLLGTALDADQCADCLTPLGFEVAGAPDEALEVSVPTWRPDCSREVDLIEEVARIYGYDKIDRKLPARVISAVGLSKYQKDRRLARDALVGAGADEAWTSTFLSAGDMANCLLDVGTALEVENPLDRSQGLLRTSLLPGLLNALRANRERQAGALSLFEVGNVFSRPNSADGPDGATLVPGVVENEQLALVAMGEDVDAAYAVDAWGVLAAALRLDGAAVAGPAEAANVARAAVGLGAVKATSALSALPALHPGRRSLVLGGTIPVGIVGELSAEVAQAFGLPGRVAVLVADLVPLLADAPRKPWRARPVSRYPASDLDMAFVVSDDVPAGRLAATVRQAGGDLVESVALFDVWRDASLGEGRRSLAFRARLRAPDRTLTDEEVARVRQEVAGAAQAEYGAVLRGA